MFVDVEPPSGSSCEGAVDFARRRKSHIAGVSLAGFCEDCLIHAAE